MATNALTHGDQRASRDVVHRGQPSRHERGWRELFVDQDAEAVWQRIYTLIRSADSDSDYEQTAQELFLRLLTTDRVNIYIEQGFSDDEIRDDLLSLLNA
ncbi:MAG TPA: hypothetical protein VF131_21585 [Blastocatellia bacterium]|nr:hypothetical protein [Blastocatellia bacterium]